MGRLTREEFGLLRGVQFWKAGGVDDALKQIIDESHAIVRAKRQRMLKQGFSAHDLIICIGRAGNQS